MESAPIVLMKDRRRALIPVDRIRVLNSRTRDEKQFTLNVQSIDAVGQLKDIRVNDSFLESTGCYELICGEGRLIAHQRLGRSHIRAEIVTCSRKQAYLESLVENLARSEPASMEFARELKHLHEEGWDFEELARLACRNADHVRQLVRLVERGEDRLIQGVEQEVFPISFAVKVAGSEDAAVQNMLMDAFDRGIVNCHNFARARAIIAGRMKSREAQARPGQPAGYSVETLTDDIAHTTESKNSYVREVQKKENRLFALVDGLARLVKDPALLDLLSAEGLGSLPELTGSYALAQGAAAELISAERKRQ